ncbi:hypothetical protein [Streptomyces sp. CMB-StM0423]|uniref:hypothetical protein n=1 Tax=Streptomyces sp. CMB-StM0423 TaxID=2059884 RepID=UPI000C70326C|nr:hypothetical protein [Streptomyces sp. CMB-StM0423]AUH40958.1 hypothetical protein CXR04_12455 [Streptomyces sp. CMB-StM0423]
MEWISPVSTALGAAIGVGATLLADRLRWRREREDRALESRKQLYADYSAALSRIRTALNEAVHDQTLSGEERRARVRELFLAPGAYELRHQLAILAPETVIAASTRAFKILRDTRDAILEGADATSTDYTDLEDAFDHAVGDLRRVMRADLGVRNAHPRGTD